MKSKRDLVKAFFILQSVLGDIGCVNWWRTKLGFRFDETGFVDRCGIICLNKGAVQHSYSFHKPAFFFSNKQRKFVTTKCVLPFCIFSLYCMFRTLEVLLHVGDRQHNLWIDEQSITFSNLPENEGDSSFNPGCTCTPGMWEYALTMLNHFRRYM